MRTFHNIFKVFIATSVILSATNVVGETGDPQNAGSNIQPNIEPLPPNLLTSDERAALPVREQYGSDVDRQWQELLKEQGYLEGRNDTEHILISSGKSTVSFDKGRSGWIEARVVAFKLAQARAKVNMLKLVDKLIVDSKDDVRFMENPTFGQGYLNNLEKVSQLARIGRKLADFTEASLDMALQQVQEDYDPLKYSSDDRAKKESLIEDAYEGRILTTSVYAISGAVTFAIIEGPSAHGGQHEILVGLLWSPNMMRLASSIVDGDYGMSREEAGIQAQERLPKNVGEAVASFGTSVIVNENGQRALLAYGQAEPAAVSEIDKDRAHRAAMDRAERRAEAAIASFVGEMVTMQSEDKVNARARVYAGLIPQGTRIEIDAFQQIEAVTGRVSLSNIETVWRQIVQHPETGQDIAIAVKLWSPPVDESLTMDSIAESTTNGAPSSNLPSSSNETDAPANKPIVIMRPANDKRAY